MGFTMTRPPTDSLYVRIKKLSQSDEFSDCSFLVSGKIFKAHKLILGITSPVFEAMFYGPLASNDAITITDIEPNIFQNVLNYIYTDKIEIKSVEEAYDLLYVSRKYMLENLTETSALYLLRHININNVISILNYPDYMQDKEVVSFALRLFCVHAEHLFHEQKQCITSVGMQRIVKSDEMNIPEKDLIKYVFEWTSYYCEENDIKINLANRREVLDINNIFKHLRFHSLSPIDLEEVINNSENLLNINEIADIKKFNKVAMTPTEKMLGSLDNKFIPRKTIHLEWDICQRTPIKSASPVIINQNNTIVETRIRVSEYVVISSFNVPSRMTPVINYFNQAQVYGEQFAITIINEEDNSIVKEMQFKKNVEYDSLIDITFDKPVILKKDIFYKIRFTWPLIDYYPYYYAVQKRDNMCYTNQHIKFVFEDIFRLTYGGSFLIGLKFSM